MWLSCSAGSIIIRILFCSDIKGTFYNTKPFADAHSVSPLFIAGTRWSCRIPHSEWASFEIPWASFEILWASFEIPPLAAPGASRSVPWPKVGLCLCRREEGSALMHLKRRRMERAVRKDNGLAVFGNFPPLCCGEEGWGNEVPLERLQLGGEDGSEALSP